MHTQHLIRLASETRLVNLSINYDAMKEGEASAPTAPVTLNLSGSKQQLQAAQALIQEAAKAAGIQLKTIVITPGRRQQAYLEVIAPEEDVQKGVVDLLSLVHQATHCNIGATVKAVVAEKEWKTRDGIIKNRFYPSVDISIFQPDALMQKSVGEYLYQRLRAMPLAAGHNEPRFIFEEPDLIINICSPEKGSPMPQKVQLPACAMAEHIAGTLQLYEARPHKTVPQRG